MDQADIKKAAKLIAAECVQPASNGNGYRLHACENFPAYTGLGFACAGASAKDLTIEEARAQIAAGKLQGAGLVSTNSIRGGANRKVLERIVGTTRIFEAWSDEEWVNDGAAVRVSLVGFGPIFSVDRSNRLDGAELTSIHADLTAGEGVNVTQAAQLLENANATVRGSEKGGPFDLPGELARQWLSLPNPNGRSNAEVLRPWSNGMDIAKRPSDTWLIDFGIGCSESDASLFEAPFTYALEHIKPARAKNREERTSGNWWLHRRSGEDLRAALASIPRYICTPRVSKHRLFVWFNARIYPDSATFVIARSDDTTFGILHSRFHELWSLRLGTSLEDRPRYTPTTTFETFPFPEHLTPRDTAGWGRADPISEAQPHEGRADPSPPCVRTEAPENHPAKHHADTIAQAAKRLNQLRENWLNPAEWVNWQITAEEEKAGFPKRPVAKPGHEADLKKRTLTNLYNARPAWLDLAHKALDQAVAAAYGWTDYTVDTPDEEILRRLLALNLERAAQQQETPS